MLRTEGGILQTSTEDLRLLEGTPPSSHQEQDRPDVSDIPRLRHLYRSKLKWTLAEFPRVDELGVDLGIGASFLLGVVNVGLCAHHHAPEPTLPPMFAHQPCTQFCLVHADLWDFLGPIQDDFPTAIKDWLLVLQEVGVLQDQLVELQAMERECRLQAEQQKLGMCTINICGDAPTNVSPPVGGTH